MAQNDRVGVGAVAKANPEVTSGSVATKTQQRGWPKKLWDLAYSFIGRTRSTTIVLRKSINSPANICGVSRPVSVTGLSTTNQAKWPRQKATLRSPRFVK